jgi:DNA polymerase-1
MQRLLAVDGTALAFRAFFAIRGLTDPRGRPSGALHGFGHSLLRALQDHPAQAAAVAWDTSEPTFRHQLAPDYKANREELDQDLAQQFPWMRELVELLGLPGLSRPGFEADDLLASMAATGERAGWEVRIFSSDKDMAQVVSTKVLQCPPPKNDMPPEVLGPAEIESKFGVPPRLMAEWQAMVGDSTDNVKGVPGVGPKKATLLLQKYGSLEAVLARGPQEEKGKLAESLAEHAGAARAALPLVTLRTDLDVGSIEALAPREPDWAGLETFCTEHGLGSLHRRLQEWRAQRGSGGAGAAGAGVAPVSADGRSSAATAADAAEAAGADAFRRRTPRAGFRLVRTWAELEVLRARLTMSGGFAFDTETTSVDPLRARLVGMSFSVAEGSADYVPMNLTPPLRGPAGEDAVAFLKPVLEQARLPKWGQNAKYDLHVMRQHGVAVKGLSFDTMVAHFLVAPGAAHNLDALSQRYLGLEKIPTSELLGSGRDARTMEQVPVEEVCEYACEDAEAVLRLVPYLRGEMEQCGATRLFEEVEMPLVEVLRRMEAEGVRVDRAQLDALKLRFQTRASELEAQVQELAGEAFNLNSPKQLATILFEKLMLHEKAGLKKPPRTNTGWRTDAATLELYAGQPIVDALLEYRSLTKLIGTYVDALQDWIHPDTGRIHTSFNQAVAATGRLSSSDPNLQNIPARTPEGREIRRAFVPREDGWLMVSADYSQVELRLVAHLSGDPALLGAFRDGADVHARTAALVFKVPPEQVDAALRARAKAVNFGILYGMGPARLARGTGISFAEAKAFIDNYFEALPGVRRWLDKTLADARATGEVRTLLGRRRPMPELLSADCRVRSQAENAAVNTPVQGSAADLMKVAMLRVQKRLDASGLRARLLLQVHDELVFECPAAEVPALTDLARAEMEGAMELSVPLKVDVGSGPDWESAH